MYISFLFEINFNIILFSPNYRKTIKRLMKGIHYRYHNQHISFLLLALLK